MKVYHGTNNRDLGLSDLDSTHCVSSSYGPGVYFTQHYDTAATYGCNVIAIDVDESKLVNGSRYKFSDIKKLRASGYVGCIIDMYLFKNVLIWNIDDLTHPGESDDSFNIFLDNWLKEYAWRCK